MTEHVTRHRGGGRDENGHLTLATDESLTAIAIAPGAASEYADRAREGESIAHTVYFELGTDLVNSDELTVRGARYGIVVNDWRISGRGGLEVLCTRGQG